MHSILKLGMASVIVKTMDGKCDVTELAQSFASMKIPDEGWVITDRRLVMLSIFSIFTFRQAIEVLDGRSSVQPTPAAVVADDVAGSSDSADSGGVQPSDSPAAGKTDQIGDHEGNEEGQGVAGRCYACQQPLKKLNRCAKCHVAYYCNRECQKAHWKTDRPQCEILSGAKHPLFG